MLLNARHNVNGDALVDIDSLYERRLVNFACDGPSPFLSRGPGHSTGELSVNVKNFKWGLKCISVLET